MSSNPPVTVEDVIPPVPETSVSRTPSSFTAFPLLLMFIHDRLAVLVEVPRMPLSVEFWIVPPVPAEPLPLTVRPPLDPVVLRLMPLTAPFDEMLLKLSPLALLVI